MLLTHEVALAYKSKNFNGLARPTNYSSESDLGQ